MAILGVVFAALVAQTPTGRPAPPAHHAPTVGLALSGGAARALAHIGVLKVLEQAGVPVDRVAGTSMGSVIGGLYAVGYGAARLETIVTGQDWSRVLSDPVDRRDLPVARKETEDRYLLTLPIYHGAVHLPRGVVPGERAWELLTRLTWNAHAVRDFRRLAIPFVAVATDLETGEAVVLDHGFLPDAIRASMAIPSVFTPVELDGRVLVDGGVVRNLPAEDVRALGADVVVCSDVTDPLAPRDSIESLLDVLAQSVAFRTWDSEARERRACDVLIAPDVHAFSTFAFDHAADVIARGERAAQAALPALEAKLAGAVRRRPSRPPLVEPESVLVVGVQFEPARRRSPALLTSVLGVRAPAWVSPRTLGRRIERLYATGWFASVRYRLDTVSTPPGDPDGAARRQLTVLLSERPAGRFALGWRYDSRYKASVLAASTLGAEGEAELRLGQQIRAALATARDLGDPEHATVGAGATFEHAPFDLFQNGRRVAEARVDLVALQASLARSLGTAVGGSVRVKAEQARWAPEVSAVDSTATNYLYTTVMGSAELDTYDDGLYPSSGVGLRATTEWGGRVAGSGTAFSHHVGALRAFLPLGRRVSLWGGATVGASGGTPPPHYLFFLGSANTYYLFADRAVPFAGLHAQERRGRHVQKAELGLQWKLSVAPDLFARLRWNVGTVLDRWTFTPRTYTQGGALDVGARTIVGRFSISVAKSGRSPPIVELDLGYPF